jgi:hypothetical protein
MDIEKKVEAIKAKLMGLQSEFEATPAGDRFWIEQEIDSLESLLWQTRKELG